jgi:hypothetical protein
MVDVRLQKIAAAGYELEHRAVVGRKDRDEEPSLNQGNAETQTPD